MSAKQREPASRAQSEAQGTAPSRNNPAAPPALPASEVAEMLLGILSGERQLFVEAGYATWDKVWCGEVHFATDDGWQFVVFNDCDEFDYVAEATAPDGRTESFDGWLRASWSPSDDGPSTRIAAKDEGLLEQLADVCSAARHREAP